MFDQRVVYMEWIYFVLVGSMALLMKHHLHPVVPQFWIGHPVLKRWGKGLWTPGLSIVTSFSGETTAMKYFSLVKTRKMLIEFK